MQITIKVQITKEFKIDEVKATRAINAPLQIVLSGEKKSFLTLNKDICTRFNIPMSLDLVDRTLVCSFESRELPLKNQRPFYGCVNMESFGSDDLKIDSLKKSKIMSPSFTMIPPSKHSEVSRTLELSSFGGGDGMHLSPLPCPFYQIVLELTDEEYKVCKILPPTSIFKVSFRLA